MLMRVNKLTGLAEVVGGGGGSASFPTFSSKKFNRWRIQSIKPYQANASVSNVKKAKLSARRRDRIKLPIHTDASGGRTYHISEFLSHPSGVEAILNTNAMISFQPLDSNTYRCILPQVQLLQFEAAPILDLKVIPTREDCMVEMLSCKFEGSEVVKRQNNHFSASMRNRITWDANGSESFLNVDVNLYLTLEIYTQPFTLLPTSAVEGPGNLIMQALVDRLVPLLLQQLLQDYSTWVQQQNKNQREIEL